jgi:hypothetical protein
MYIIQKRENILKTLENKNPEHPPDAPFFQNGVVDSFYGCFVHPLKYLEPKPQQ